ncbi:MAG: hypothetical protein KAR11_06165 [Phycisphaerae bacterium]|nr:hypothetical protein [Phycisphaerae bacterium]
MNNSFPQPDLEKISAWMDGELDPAQEREVQQRIEEYPQWAQAYRELQGLEKALDLWEIPAASHDLADKIIKHNKPKPLLLRATKWVAPLATAAVVVLMVLAFQQGNPRRTTNRGLAKSGAIQKQQQIRQTDRRVPTVAQQRMLLENYSRRMQLQQQWLAQNGWLIAVLRSFTPDEVKQLQTFPQNEVNKRIIQRRDELIEKGVLKRVPSRL